MAVRQILSTAHRCSCRCTSRPSLVTGLMYSKSQRYSCAKINENIDSGLLKHSLGAEEKYDDLTTSHIPTSAFQKALLAVGSASISLFDPTRPEMIAVLGETTGLNALQFIHKIMSDDKEGREILSEKPRINSRTLNLNGLSKMPKGTLGKVYTIFLEKYKISPDSRTTVQFVDDVELAYVMQRYREVHDLVHTILNMPTNMLGEVSVKWVEGIQTRLPMCIGGALLGPIRFGPKFRQKYVKYYLPWAIKTGFEAKFLMNVYYEKRWEQPVQELLEELNIKPLKL